MVQQSTLLQIIQFVGLIAPALAILIELLVRFHGGLDELSSKGELPVEIQILFFGFSGILFGGMLIGIQFGLTLNNQLTQIATILIFGGLPFLAIAIILINVRISGVSNPRSSTLENLSLNIRYALSIALPATLTIVLFFGGSYYLRQNINSIFDWWVFNDLVEPVWYFYAVSGFSLYKLMYSLWTHEYIPTTNYTKSISGWFLVSFTIGGFLLVLSGSVFGIYYILLTWEISFITRTSFLSAIPYIWGGMMVLVMTATEIDPDPD